MDLFLRREMSVNSQTLTRLTAEGLAQSVERLTAERELAGSIPGVRPILRVLKQLRNEITSFALQMARHLRGSDDHVRWWSRLQCPQLALSCQIH